MSTTTETPSKAVLPANYRHSFEEAMASMIANQSPLSQEYLFYAHMVTQCSVNFTMGLETAGVCFQRDHYRLSINPTFFDSLPLEQRCGVLKHEMLHILGGHLIRLEDRDFKQFNYATDCAINQLTTRSHLPQGAIYPDNFPGKPGVKIPEKLTAEHYYDLIDPSKLPEDGDGAGGSGAGGSGDGQGNSNGTGTVDDHGEWKNSEGLNESLQKDITKNMMEKAARQTQKSRGNMPSEYSDWLELNSNKAKVDWRRVLRGICGNKRVNSRRTIMRMDRRFMNREDLRGKTKDRMFTLLLVGDESGSVSDVELSEGIAEILHICEVTKSELDYIAIDTQAHAPTKIKRTQRNFKRQACGGTNLHPALDMAKQHRIDYQAVVVITDGGLCSSDVDHFAKLGKRVIWLITSQGHIMDDMNKGLMSAFKLAKD